MANFDSVESAREFFYKDKYAVMTGVTLDELTEDEAICSLEITDDHRNAYGGVMGGVMFTLADFAFAVLSNQKVKNYLQRQLAGKMAELPALSMLTFQMILVVMLPSLLEPDSNYNEIR